MSLTCLVHPQHPGPSKMTSGCNPSHGAVQQCLAPAEPHGSRAPSLRSWPHPAPLPQGKPPHTAAGCPMLCLHPVPQPRKHPSPEIRASDPLCFSLSKGISAVTLLSQEPAASAPNYKALHFGGQALAGFGGARHCLRRLQRNFRCTPAAGHPWQLSPGRLQEERVGPC